MLSICELEKSKYSDWNQVVENAKNGLFLFNIDYFKYHEARFDDCSLMIYKKNKAVALFPANRVNDTIYSHQGLTFGGLIMLPELHTADVLEIFDLINNHYKNNSIKKVVYKAIPYPFAKYPAQEDLYALFRSSAKLIRRDVSSVIDLLDRPKLSDSRKNTIVKAQKNDVKICESSDLKKFHGILSEVLAKFGASPVHSIAELEQLKEAFPQNIKLYAAMQEEQWLAGVLVYDYGHIIHTQYMANTQQGRQIGALDYILFTLINEIYTEKKYLSFGISTENAGQYLNTGLIAQKEGFGARAVVHDFYEMELL
ncbi:GNAT family N-acetyltransferase [Cronobacter muytjensii]|uniref:GNAT family N-acetyltransferase n=1 Tax=Cronobacter muytjensii TaxID=413501 RepID=UPI00158829B2|nr:GNAT family N-acetyltransferase [Cronobacter muytjensii]EKS1846392.1 GNAT family N-acetyltransferase [Cronobacter muytjensii]MEB8638401.1 GNAT family N-acetyltransferase [Cronobacter muytjensii]NUW58483.1 GNAT family N-acetyltransferase [Cronobacter muytjensii]